MTSLPEQFQAARQTQLDNQFRFLRLVSDGMLDRTGRLLALHLETSRAAVEQSSSTMRQLLALRDPRDLLSIGAQTQRQLRSMFDYGRELFSITTGLRGIGLQTYSVEASTPALAAPAAVETAPLQDAEIVADATAAVSASVEEVLAETASHEASPGETIMESVTASVTESAIEPAAAPDTEPAPETPSVSVSAAEIELDTTPVVTSTITPPLEPTPIARATSEVLDMPIAPPHPVAASVPVEVAVEIEVPKAVLADTPPPVVVPSGNGPKVTEIRSGRGRKKQS